MSLKSMFLKSMAAVTLLGGLSACSETHDNDTAQSSDTTATVTTSRPDQADIIRALLESNIESTAHYAISDVKRVNRTNSPVDTIATHMHRQSAVDPSWHDSLTIITSGNRNWDVQRDNIEMAIATKRVSDKIYQMTIYEDKTNVMTKQGGRSYFYIKNDVTGDQIGIYETEIKKSEAKQKTIGALGL